MSFLKAVLALALSALTTGSAFAAITVNDLSGLPPLNVSTSPLTGINIDPFSSVDGLQATVVGANVEVREFGIDAIGVGSTVPLGTDLTGFTAPFGQTGFFPLSSPSGEYYMPFSSGADGGGPAYLTFDYDNPSQTLTFVSSTTQNAPPENLTVVPEPGSLAFLALAGCGLFLRRRKTA